MILKILNMTEHDLDTLTPWCQIAIGTTGLIVSVFLLTTIITYIGG